MDGGHAQPLARVLADERVGTCAVKRCVWSGNGMADGFLCIGMARISRVDDHPLHERRLLIYVLLLLFKLLPFPDKTACYVVGGVSHCGADDC